MWTTECHPIQPEPDTGFAVTCLVVAPCSYWSTDFPSQLCSRGGTKLLPNRESFVIVQGKASKKLEQPGTCWLPDQNQTLTSPFPSLLPKVNTTAAYFLFIYMYIYIFIFPLPPVSLSSRKTSDNKTSDLLPGEKKKRKHCH